MSDRMQGGHVLAVRVGVMLAAGALALAACSSGAATTAPSASAETSTAPSAVSSAASSASGARGYSYGGGSSTSPSSAAAGGAMSGQSIKVIDFGFDPASITVKVGTSVTWTNTGAVGHTVTADDTSFDSGHLAPAATFSQSFAKAGTFTYHCKIHPSMKGTVIVTP